MLDFINTSVVYWHWIVFGLLLITIELFVPVFVTLWLGAAAIIVGMLMLLTGMGVNAQLAIWVVLSTAFVLLWHKYISPRLLDKTTAGLSKEAMVGQQGLVIEYNAQATRGTLRFPAPVLGNDEWEFLCESELSSGDKVQVTDISGNRLIVKPY